MQSRKKWKNRYYKIKEKEQKLIEKLEEDIIFRKSKTDCNYCNNTCSSYAVCKYAQEILEILKGEK